MGSSRGSKWLKYLKNLGTKSLYFFCSLCYNINNKRKGKARAMERAIVKGNVTNQEYIRRTIVRETEKAYLIEQEVNNRRDGWHTNFRWVAKKCCKDRENDTVLVPEWLVSNGVW